MARLLTLDGAPRTPKKEEKIQTKKEAAANVVGAPHPGPRMGPQSIPEVQAQLLAAARRMNIGAVSPDGSSAAADLLRQLRERGDQQRANRATIGAAARAANQLATAQTEAQERAERTARLRRERRHISLGHLFDPSPVSKPSVTVIEALRFLSSNNGHNGECMSVVRDMAGRMIVSEKQHSYAKSICLKPHNRAALNEMYDLRALNAERFDPQSVSNPVVTSATAFAPGTYAHFGCLVNSAGDNDVNVTFGFNLSTVSGKPKGSVRTLTIPRSRCSLNGRAGERGRIAVDADWLHQMRGTDPRRIPDVTFETV